MTSGVYYRFGKKVLEFQKYCKKCDTIKNLIEFPLLKSGKYNSPCMPCAKLASKLWKNANKDKVKLTNKNCHKKHYEKNSEILKEKSRNYYKEHSVELNSRRKNQKKEYRESHRCERRFDNANRRVKKLQATPKWANKNYIKLFYKLAREDELNTGIPHNVDHIIPLISNYVCGFHCEDNLDIKISKENMSKSNKWWPDMPVINDELKQLAKNFYVTN